jgi:threonine/homoserine/homoserine lactone efflux protein
MLLLITFITIWALSPGPVLVMTLHETRKRGSRAGIAVASGATVTAAVMVLSAIFIHLAGFSALLAAAELGIIEQIGAVGIILMGVYAGIKSLSAGRAEPSGTLPQAGSKAGFFQGMLMMATYFPQALVFYNMIVPKSVELSAIITTIILLGVLKVILIFAWHSGIAIIVTRVQSRMRGQRLGKLFELSSACLIIGLGVNILV